MKKSLLLGAFALLGFAASAQTTGQLKIGANIGIPVTYPMYPVLLWD
ncbi:hypothetical protein VO54_01182 [Elizabethkingia miricola]|nr:hypothetical protein VO54_01182 [Elizabethkingia miricola]